MDPLSFARRISIMLAVILLLTKSARTSTSKLEDVRQRRVVTGNSRQYYEFNTDLRTWVTKECGFAFGQQMVFEVDRDIPEGGSCKPSDEDKPRERQKRQGGTVDYPCFENTDCAGSGMYCSSTKRCACLSTFVEIGGTCWQKINPDEAGCVNNRQCSAVWPGAFCSSGTCRCANNQNAFPTRDGPICLNYGFCPINGDGPRYRPDGISFQCWDDSQCPGGYDCICSTPGCGLETGQTTMSFCCPSRAMACIQALDEGTIPVGGSGGGVLRYYYNTVTGNCETFMFRGNGGNANNFDSKEHCESYCRQSCARGQPQYDINNSPGVLYKDKPQFCTSSSSCDQDHTCKSVGTNSLCCPKQELICSKKGGFNTEPVDGVGYDAGVYPMAGGTQMHSRFYYDGDEHRCLPFQYKGQGGNFNNFLTREHCEQFCAAMLCPAGEPLKDISGITYVKCTSGTVCPATHECTKEFCCPKKQTVCSMAKAVGTCANYVERWWFNAATRNCELFTFSGCQGNANNFASYVECQNFCRDTTVEPKCIQGKGAKDSYGNYVVCGGQSSSTCPANYDCFFDGSFYGCCPTKSFTCSQQPDQGVPCGPKVSRWFYNTASRSCQPFEYSGCDGNSNNHATQQDCIDYCGVGGCPEGGEPFKESNGAYRVCTGGMACPYTHFCTQVTLGSSAVYNYCCPSRSYVCSLPRDQGQRCSSTTLNRYFFNVATRNCESFTYNGCGGNRNNFGVLSQCLNYCNSAGCPAGTIALTDRGSSVLTSCVVGQAGSCPVGYMCTFSSLLSQNICCGAPGSGDKCPAGQTTYIDAITSGPMQCTPNVIGNCPSGYICWYSMSSNAYYCCGTAATQCPQGGSVFINQATNSAQQCTPGVAGACQTGFNCQATSLSVSGVPSTTGYCCGSTGMCPNNGQVQIVNNIPVPCQTSSPNVCTTPYTCQYSSTMNQYYCCTQGVAQTTPVCGSQLPYIINGAPVVCSSGSASTNCPSPYSCQLYAATNSFYCCQTGAGAATPAPLALPTGNCPPGFNALRSGSGDFQYCSPNMPSTCPGGYYCQYDSISQRYICCGSGVPPQVATPPLCGCPNQRTCYVPSGQQIAQQCTPGQTVACPPGYTCQYSNVYLRYQCCQGISMNLGVSLPMPQPLQSTSDPFGCPEGSSYLYPSTTIPLACRPMGFSCPAGYRCVQSMSYSGYQCCSSGGGFLTHHAQPPSSLQSQERSTQRVLRPGDMGCRADHHCRESGEAYARCANGRCICTKNLLVHGGRCVPQCPWPYVNNRGVCALSSTLVKLKFNEGLVDKEVAEPKKNCSSNFSGDKKNKNDC